MMITFENQLKLIQLHSEPDKIIEQLLGLDLTTTKTGKPKPSETGSSGGGGKHYSSEDNEQIIKLWQEGLSEDEIAADLGRTPRGIRDQVIKLRKQYPDELPYVERYDQLGFARWVKDHPDATEEEKDEKRKIFMAPKEMVHTELDPTQMAQRLERDNGN